MMRSPGKIRDREVHVQSLWSKATLNYWMMVERYPNLKEEVGGSIPAVKSPLYLTETWRWFVSLLSPENN